MYMCNTSIRIHSTHAEPHDNLNLIYTFEFEQSSACSSPILVGRGRLMYNLKLICSSPTPQSFPATDLNLSLPDFPVLLW